MFVDKILKTKTDKSELHFVYVVFIDIKFCNKNRLWDQ